MSKTVRGEPTGKEFFYEFRRGMLDAASSVAANGGPRNPFEQRVVEGAGEIGISDVEIRAAASSKRPVLKGLEEYIPIDNF